MASRQIEFVPWRKAFMIAGVKDLPANPRGYWGHRQGWGARVVCSVWDDKIMGGEAKAFIPKDNKSYREAAEALSENDNVIVILKSRSTNQGKVLPTLWKVRSRHLDQPTGNSIGYLTLANTGIELETG